MTQSTGLLADHYRSGVSLFEAGRLEEAITAFEAYLKERPCSARAWNSAGAVLFRLGRTEQAIRYFMNALRQDDRPAAAYRNLIYAYLKQGEPGKAVRWLKAVDHEPHADIELVLHIAEAFRRQVDYASAMEILQYGKRLEGDRTLLEQRIGELKDRRAKIAFFVDRDMHTVLEDIIHYTQQRYPVRVFEGKASFEAYQLMQWSDISWFDGCTDLAQIGSTFPKVCYNIIRLHRCEANTSRPETINWENIDTVVTVGDSRTDNAKSQLFHTVQQKVPIVNIGHGLNLDRIKFKRRRPGRNIALDASLETINPMLLMDCMAELWRHDGSYQFWYAATHDNRLRQYLENGLKRLNKEYAVHFGGLDEDVQTRLSNKDYLVAVNAVEYQGAAILEAMASGIKPVIHDFPGAEEMYGSDFLFSSPQEFCQRILSRDYDSEQYRILVERKYPLRPQLMKINELFADFEKQCSAGLTGADEPLLAAAAV